MIEGDQRTPPGHEMTHLRSSCLLLVALVAVGCGTKAPPETAPPPPDAASRTAAERIAAPAPAPAPVRVHIVEPGDTLWSLARRYGVTVDDFVRANDLADPDSLSVGEHLILPDNATGGAWVWPVAGGAVVSAFGARRGGDVHRGIDIDADPGQQVVAAAAGVVVYAGSNMRDYGRAVIIDHGNGVTSLYGHNSELLVSEGERVAPGQPIALAGQTGNATGVHCHFEIRRNAVALDPLSFVAGEGR